MAQERWRDLGRELRRAHWPADEPAIRAVRDTVFVREQGVAAALEWDGQDATAYHVLAVDARGRAIGTGRLLASGRLGRMAVLAAWRGRGVGRALLVALIDVAHGAGRAHIHLSAQTRAVGFYARHGFAPVGGIYLDAGIPHQRMVRSLDAQTD
jgi:predicted GNAT family N-acyltransferase